MQNWSTQQCHEDSRKRRRTSSRSRESHDTGRVQSALTSSCTSGTGVSTDNSDVNFNNVDRFPYVQSCPISPPPSRAVDPRPDSSSPLLQFNRQWLASRLHNANQTPFPLRQGSLNPIPLTSSSSSSLSVSSFGPSSTRQSESTLSAPQSAQFHPAPSVEAECAWEGPLPAVLPPSVATPLSIQRPDNTAAQIDPPQSSEQSNRDLDAPSSNNSINCEDAQSSCVARQSYQHCQSLLVSRSLPADRSPSYMSVDCSCVSESAQLSTASAFPEIDELNSLKSETLLYRLVELKGREANIFLDRGEIGRLHVEKSDKQLALFQRQRIVESRFVRSLCHGRGPSISIGILGLILFIFGTTVQLCGREFREKVIFYNSNDTSKQFPLDVTGWSEDAEAFVYFYIQGFYGCFRGTYASRPQHLFPGYSCDTPGTLNDISAIRPLHTLPEINSSVGMSLLSISATMSRPITLRKPSPYFPCGSSSFSLFNDWVELVAIDTSRDPPSQTPVSWSVQNIAPIHSLINYARIRRPDNKTPDQDWIKVISPQYRNWMEPPLGSERRLLIGRIPSGLSRGEYGINIRQNVWPSELWSAQKAIVFSQLSVIGTPQKVLAAVFMGWGALMVALSLLFLLSSRTQWRWKTQSASEVPEERIREVIEALLSQNKAARQLLFSRLQKRRMDTIRQSTPASV